MMGDCRAAIPCECEKAAIYGANFSAHGLNLISPDVYSHVSSKYMI